MSKKAANPVKLYSCCLNLMANVQVVTVLRHGYAERRDTRASAWYRKNRTEGECALIHAHIKI